MVSEEFGRFYSPAKLLEKVRRMPREAGSQIIRQAVTLYVILQDASVPTWVKAMIVAALGYFICPVDVIPDFLPCGFADDLVVMLATLQQVVVYRSPSVQQQVEEILRERLL